MPKKLIAFVVVLAASAVMPQAQAPDVQVLWYRAPAANWNEALPVGNGRLGAMVFGGVSDERLQLNLFDLCYFLHAWNGWQQTEG